MSSLSPTAKATGGIIYQATGADKDAVARSVGVDPVSEPDLFLFLSKALDARLPHPWTEHADKKGRIFYWNPASRHSSWQHPLTPSHKSLVAAYRRIMQEEDRQAAIQLELEAFTQQVEEEVGKWRQSHAPDGTPYFYKLGTQITRWDNPRDELMAHMELRVQMLDELAHRPLEGESATAMPEDGANRTQQMLTDAIMSTSQTTLAASGALQAPASLRDATASSFQSKPQQPLALQDQSDSHGSGTLRSPTGRGRKGKKQGARSPASASASEASDTGSRGESPKSNGSTARSIFGYLSPGARKRNKQNPTEQKKAGRGIIGLVSHLSPKFRQRQELAALKVTRAAKKWLAWSRAKKSEAALVVQKSYRGWQGRKAFAEKVQSLEEERRAAEAMPPELDYLGRTLLEAMNTPLGMNRSRITFERSNLLSAQGDIDLSQYIFPDEIALHHGMNFDIPVDKAIFNIIRPLFLRPLPVPWQILQRYHGRVDFFHAGVQEERRQHPLHSFFGEVITFLKAHVHTDVPMVEPMTAQVFREASPQYVRQRLGVWEGPHEDASNVGGLRFLRLIPGEDKDCAEGDVRYDDPRLEAAASVMSRMASWLHLWLGFAPEEPFPFLEGRLPALAAQISESVVVAPGAASEALLAQVRGAAPLAQLAVPAHPLLDAKEPEVLPLTKEEEALQPVVTGTLGKAYGAALEYVAKLESGKLEEEKPPKPVVVEDEESEAEYTEIGEDEEEYEDSFSEEEEEDEEEYESDADEKEEETEEDISAATTAAQTPQSSRRPMQNVEALEKELAEEEVEELPPKEVSSFLPGYGEQSAADWAARNLRPLTPTQELKAAAAAAAPLTLPSTQAKRPWHRLEPRTDQEQLWGENTLLAEAQERLELKEPPLADWGKFPEAVGSAADGAFVPSPVPLSPDEKARAAKALPHLAGSMKKGELLKIRQEQQDRVNNFAKSLLDANSNFNSLLDEAETPPGSPSGRWRCGRQAPGDDEEFRGRRPALDRPHLPANLSAEDVQDDVCPIKGCIARANSPTKGSMPVPPHLEGATKASKKNNLQAWPVSRSASAGPTVDRIPPGTRYELPRPRSARAHVRPRGRGLLLAQPSKAAQEAAASCRRFLSRECGTMPLALNTFDSTGHGKFNRWEWETGLEKLGYEAHYDVQEIFTVLDKRRHHVLTLSDLLDHFNGRPIAEGLPDPGLQGIVSEIIQEAMTESIGPVVTQALAELLQKELLAPRGPPYTLPSIKAVLKKSKKDTSTRKLARNPNQPLELGDESRLLSPGSSAKKTRRNQFGLDSQSSIASSRRASTPKRGKSPSGRRAKKNLTKLKTVGQLMKNKGRKGTEPGSGATPPESPSGGTLTGTFNSTLSGPLGGSEKSLSGSPFRVTSSRKKGMLGSTGMRSQSANGNPKEVDETLPVPAAGTPGTDGEPRKSSRSPQRSRRSPSPKQKKHLASSSSKASPPRGSSSVAGSRHSKSLQTRSTQSRSSQARSENKYVGYNFVREEEPSLRGQEQQESLGDWQREKLLPWMPRPTEDICRTYGHIFRLLNDPKTKRISEKPQKKTLHVSVPRMPTVPPGRGHVDRPDSGVSDEESLGPLPSMLSTGSKLPVSKSSPDLMISHLSTTAGSARPDSAGSWASDDGRRTGVNLRRVNPIDGGMRRRAPH